MREDTAWTRLHIRQSSALAFVLGLVFATVAGADDKHKDGYDHAAHSAQYRMVVIPPEKIKDRLSLGASTHAVRSSQHTGRRYTSPPYMDIDKGKGDLRLRNYPEYMTKLHDFYRRQALHHMQSSGGSMYLPGFPDLDGGISGHHPAYNKNGVSSPMRDGAVQGNVLQYVGPNRQYGFRLGQKRDWMLVYDTDKGQPLQLLKNGDVDYDDYRYSTARQAKTVGDVHHQWSAGSWQKAEFYFSGHYRHDGDAVLSYRIAGAEVRENFQVQDAPEEQSVLVQNFYFPGAAPKNSYVIGGLVKKDAVVSEDEPLTFVVAETVENQATLIAIHLEADGGSSQAGKKAGTVSIEFGQRVSASTATVVYWTGDKQKLAAVQKHIIANQKAYSEAAHKIPGKLKGSTKQEWPHILEGKGEVAADSSPYVIDTLPIPLVNPYRAPMFLSGITFDEEGVAYVCTLFGEVWKVSGIDHGLENVRWKRMIAGLNSTLGILYHKGELFVADKAELISLHDLNGDDEIDYIQRCNQGFRNFGRNVHAGLAVDDNDAFYYITGDGLARLANDKYEVFAPPLRTAMGVGITHDNRIWAAPQEGGGTPASAIYEYHDGDDLYRPMFRGSEQDVERERLKLDPALVYIPRGVDNSTACALAVSSDRFGPIDSQMLSFSYGACSTQLVLRDKPPGASRFQGAVVPIPGNFFSGANHGAVNPKDGQVYIVGHDGWGTYAISDGSIQRLRKTSRPAYYPVGFRLYTNGVRVEFDKPLDRDAATNIENLFSQQWNYVYSAAYGSPEFSVRSPNRKGHDRLKITSSHLLDDGKSLFVEIDDLSPSMTTHLFGKLKGKDGESFELNMFMTGLFLAKAFDGHLDKPLPPHVANRTKTLTLPFTDIRAKQAKIADADREGAKNVELIVNDALTFTPHSAAKETFQTLVAGDRVVFRIRNSSKGGMGHNAVIVRREDAMTVGEASDRIVSDPRALENSYVPKFLDGMAQKVIAHSTVVAPGDYREFLFRADKAGAYTMMCTFPGHWRIMQVDFNVYESLELAKQGAAALAAQEAEKLEPILLKESFDALATDARKFGDIQRGRELFYTGKVGCAACHDPAKGRPLGPNLLEKRDVEDAFLVESILRPSKTIRKGYEPMHVMTDAGKMLIGFRVREDEDTLVLRDTVLGNKTHDFRKRDLELVMQMSKSTMPERLANQLASRADFLDLVRFVMAAATGQFSRQKTTSSVQADDREELFAGLKKREDISFLQGKAGKPYIHFFAAEAEYGAFFSMPMIAEILNHHHGFSVSVSYSLDKEGNVDSRVRNGLRGFELLKHADLAVFFTRTKYLTKESSQQIQRYLDGGKPIVGFRTANHGFTFPNDSPDADYLREEGWTHKGPRLCYMWKHKFGGHHGGSPKDGDLTSISLGKPTRHPIVRGFKPYRDPRHLYILLKEPGKDRHDFIPLVYGEALKIFPHKAHLPKTQPTLVISETARRMVYSSTCGADTFQNESARRLAVQSIFWALGLEEEIPAEGLKVDFVRPYLHPDDTHLREGDPHRGKPAHVFAPSASTEE